MWNCNLSSRLWSMIRETEVKQTCAAVTNHDPPAPSTFLKWTVIRETEALRQNGFRRGGGELR
jgi:hypothetical protein